MLVKIIIIALLVGMLASLAIGLFHLLKAPSERDKGDRVVKALTWRIGIWAALLGFMLIAMKAGWIEPSNSVNPYKFNQEQEQRILQENQKDS